MVLQGRTASHSVLHSASHCTAHQYCPRGHPNRAIGALREQVPVKEDSAATRERLMVSFDSSGWLYVSAGARQLEAGIHALKALAASRCRPLESGLLCARSGQRPQNIFKARRNTPQNTVKPDSAARRLIAPMPTL